MLCILLRKQEEVEDEGELEYSVYGEVERKLK